MWENLYEKYSGYKEIEFVCVNPNFPRATDLQDQINLYEYLKTLSDVITLRQDWGDGQISLTAIYKDKRLRPVILQAAKTFKVEVDLEQDVSDGYVNEVLRGERENQINN